MDYNARHSSQLSPNKSHAVSWRSPESSHPVTKKRALVNAKERIIFFVGILLVPRQRLLALVKLFRYVMFSRLTPLTNFFNRIGWLEAIK